MIAFISLCYASLYLLIFNKLKLLQKTTGNISAFIGIGVGMIAAIIFTWYTFSPMAQDGRVFRYVIPIVPNVKGELVEVPVKPFQEAQQGDILFKIDPTPYALKVDELEARVEQLDADRDLAMINLDRAQRLLKSQAAAQLDVDTWTAKLKGAEAAIESTQAQLANARWQLEETVVRAPADGYAVNVQIRPGSFVTNIPMASSLAFVSYDTTEIAASFSQSAIRRIEVGNKIEVVFNSIPGQVYAGEVTSVGKASGDAQLQASGTLPTMTGQPGSGRWVTRIELDDKEFARTLPQGAAGSVAVYTDYVKPVHIISKVVMRMNAWMGYLTSP
jgi:RND family efflux transporter MFP subunit